MIKKILIVGLGSIGLRHFQIAKQLLPNAIIKAMGMRRVEGRNLPPNSVIFDLKEAKEFSPDLVVICVPSSHHLEMARFFMDLNVHIFIEKPLSSSTKDVSNFIKVAKSTGKCVMVGYNLRFSESLIEFRNQLLNGVIGDLLSIRCEVGQYLPSWRPQSDYRDSVSARSELGGGVLLELSHEIDYLRWIFGEVDWVSATLAKHSELEIDVEDTAYLVLSFREGNKRPLVASLNMDFVRHDRSRYCIAIGSKGSLRWDGITREVQLFEEGSKTWQSIFKEKGDLNQTYLGEWKHFLGSIEKNTDPKVTVEDGLSVLEIIEAARISSESGVKIRIRNNQDVTRSIL